MFEKVSMLHSKAAQGDLAAVREIAKAPNSIDVINFRDIVSSLSISGTIIYENKL